MRSYTSRNSLRAFPRTLGGGDGGGDAQNNWDKSDSERSERARSKSMRSGRSFEVGSLYAGGTGSSALDTGGKSGYNPTFSLTRSSSNQSLSSMGSERGTSNSKSKRALPPRSQSFKDMVNLRLSSKNKKKKKKKEKKKSKRQSSSSGIESGNESDSSMSSMDSSARSTSSFTKGSTRFSSKLANKKFLTDDDSEEEDPLPPVIGLEIKSSNNNNASTTSRNNSTSDLEWNPEMQRQQQDEWRRARIQQQSSTTSVFDKQQQVQAQTSAFFKKKKPPKQSNPAPPNAFPQRQDLREVDQSINLAAASSMEQSDSQKRRTILGEESNNSNNNPGSIYQDSSGNTVNSSGVRPAFTEVHLDRSELNTSRASFGNRYSSGGNNLRGLPDYYHASGGRKRRNWCRCGQADFWLTVCVILIVASILGVSIAWSTGAFTKPDEAALQEVVPVTEAPTVTVVTPEPTDKPKEEEEPPKEEEAPKEEEPAPAPAPPAGMADKADKHIMKDLKQLLLDLHIIKDEQVLEKPSNRNDPFSPQYLALYWVSRFQDPMVWANDANTNHLLMHPNAAAVMAAAEDRNDETTDQGNDVASKIANLDANASLRLQAFALAIFFYATNENTLNGGRDRHVYTLQENPVDAVLWYTHDKWMTPQPICTWHGITCQTNPLTETTIVSQLNLTNNYLMGMYLPEETLRIFMGLQVLDLSRNHIGGPLPSDFILTTDGTAAASKLEHLWLHTNRLEGTVPQSWGQQLVNLERLSIGQNKLFGTLPLNLDQLTKLKSLVVDSNDFTGELPYIEHMTELEYFIFYNNLFSNNIPYSTYRVGSLLEIRGQLNRLTGTIPSELQHLTRLKVLQLEENELSGTLPNVFDKLPNLVEVTLQENKFEGAIPDTLGSATSLGRLLINKNGFSGSMPDSICQLKTDFKLNSFSFDCDAIQECICCDQCK